MKTTKKTKKKRNERHGRNCHRGGGHNVGTGSVGSDWRLDRPDGYGWPICARPRRVSALDIFIKRRRRRSWRRRTPAAVAGEPPWRTARPKIDEKKQTKQNKKKQPKIHKQTRTQNHLGRRSLESDEASSQDGPTRSGLAAFMRGVGIDFFLPSHDGIESKEVRLG